MSTAEDWHSAPCGLLVLDADGIVTAANRTLLGWVDRTAAEVLGRVRFGDLLSVGGRIYWETHLAPRLRLQGDLDEVTVELRRPSGRVPVLLSAVAAPGGDRVDVALSTARERVRFERELRAAREQAQQANTRLQALQAVTAALSGAVGVVGVADALLTAALGTLGAPGAALWTVQEGHLHLHATRGGAAAPGPAVPGGVVDAPRWAAGRLDVPLHGGSGLRGLLSLSRSAPVSAPELEVFTAIGQQAGLALDRAHLNERSADVAHHLQHAMVAVDPPPDPRYAVGATYRAGVEMLEVGGDWYDVFTVGLDVLGVVVGDVVGRGLAAASAMGQLRSAVRAVAEPGLGPAGVLTRLDRFVAQVPDAQMATVAYVELDLAGGVLRYACAGHPPPLLVTGQADDRYLWGGRSTPLGTGRDGVPRTEADLQLRRGDRVLLYTDGLVERRDRGLDEGMGALARAVDAVRDRPPAGLVDAVTAVMLAGEEVSDDVCTVLLAWSAGGGQQTPHP